MGELHDWLTGQHPGLKTFKTFRQKALDCAAGDARHRALYRLLAELTGEYIARYDGEPVPVEVAKHSYRHLLAIVTDAENVLTAPVPTQIDVLNKLAAAKLV